MSQSSHEALFICFEGIAGAGKSTQTLALKRKIETETGRSVFISKAYERERKQAADLLIKAVNLEARSLAMMFLFQALHAKQFEETQLALQQGSIVIADRWRESFWAYHTSFGSLAKEPREVLEVLDRLAYGDLKPHITFLLDVPVGVAIQRFLARDPESILYDRADMKNFWGTFRSFYQETARKSGWHVTDATQPLDRVSDAIWQQVRSLL